MTIAKYDFISSVPRESEFLIGRYENKTVD